MPHISTHILDIAKGRPAKDVPVRLERRATAGNWQLLTSATTDKDGRCAQLLPDEETLSPGVYRLVFNVAEYYVAQKVESLYPTVEIVFYVRTGEERFHIPLLLSPNGYTTYRGS